MNRKSFFTALGVNPKSSTAIGAANLFKAMPHFNGDAKTKVRQYLIQIAGFTSQDVDDLEAETVSEYELTYFPEGTLMSDHYNLICEKTVESLENENGSLANISPSRFFIAFIRRDIAINSYEMISRT